MITNKIKICITLLSIILINYSCEEKTDFDKGLIFIENLFSKERLTNFKNAQGITEHSIKQNEGNVFINEYLNSPKGKKLIDFFESKEISDKKVIRDIMFTSLFRKLNSEPINLNDQIDARVVPMKLRKACKEKIKIKAQNYYALYNLGDTISVMYPVEFRNAGYYNCPNIDWTFEEGKDLKLEAVIIEKYHLIDSIRHPIQPFRYYFKVTVFKMSNWDVQVLGNRVEKNDTLVLDLNYATIDGMWE